MKPATKLIVLRLRSQLLTRFEQQQPTTATSTMNTESRKRDAQSVSGVIDGSTSTTQVNEGSDDPPKKKPRARRTNGKEPYPLVERVTNETSSKASPSSSSQPLDPVKNTIASASPSTSKLPEPSGDAEAASKTSDTEIFHKRKRTKRTQTSTTELSAGESADADVMRAIQAHVEHKVQAALSKKDQDDTKLGEKVKTLETEVAALKAEKKALRAENDGLAERASALSKDKEILRGEVSGLKEQVDKLEKEVKARGEVFANFKKRIRAMGNEP